MPAFRITLDGKHPEDITKESLYGWPKNVYVLSKTMNISQGEPGTRAVLSFSIRDESNSFYIDDLIGRLIQVWEYVGTSWELIWGGQLDEPKTRKINEARTMYLQIEGIDHHQICDRIAINQGYPRMYIHTLVKEIIDKYLNSDGIWYNSNSIQVTTKQISINCPWVYSTQVFTELADLLGWQWYIEPNKKFNFHEINFENGSYTHEYINVLKEGLESLNDRSEYYNTQVLRGVKDVTDEIIETCSPFPDGMNKNFFVNFPITDDLGEPAIYVCTWMQRFNPPESTRQTMGLSGLETTPQWFYTDGYNQIYQNSEEPAIAAGYYIVLKYRGTFEIDVVKSNTTAINERATIENGSGLYYNITSGSDVVGLVVGNEKAQAMLNKYCRIAKKFQVESYNHRWKVGQICDLVLPTFNINATGANGYLVTSLKITDVGNKLKRVVEFTDGQPVGGWVKFFKKWLTDQNFFQIREDAIVNIPIGESEPIDWDGDVTIDSIDCLYPETDPGGLYLAINLFPGTINNTETYNEGGSD
ncbi:MAG: hypothetical protein JXB50_07815 [Spirochaetes bacterium]|nr:hypothetical protein [Spirochaetota bacterium]